MLPGIIVYFWMSKDDLLKFYCKKQEKNYQNSFKKVSPSLEQTEKHNIFQIQDPSFLKME